MQRVNAGVSFLDLPAFGGWPGVRPGRAFQGRARGADAGPAAPLRGAALIRYGSIRHSVAVVVAAVGVI